jgi:hypothetical protein
LVSIGYDGAIFFKKEAGHFEKQMFAKVAIL